MIWIVDDDSTIRDIEVYTLNSTGFEAKGFASGVPMFESLKSERPELIVLDIMMPGDDGITILKKLRGNPVTKDIPIIMATAKGTEMDMITGLDTGADDYPVTLLNTAFHLLCSFIDFLCSNQFPVLLRNIQTYRRSIIILQRKLVGIGSLRNHVRRGIRVSRIMHMEIIEGLQQSVVHRHMLHSVDMEIAVGRPERVASAERM